MSLWLRLFEFFFRSYIRKIGAFLIRPLGIDQDLIDAIEEVAKKDER